MPLDSPHHQGTLFPDTHPGWGVGIYQVLRAAWQLLNSKYRKRDPCGEVV